MSFKQQFATQFKSSFKDAFKSAFSNPAGAAANYLFKDRQDLTDNVTGTLMASVSPSAVFSSNGLDLDATTACTIDSSSFSTTDFTITMPFIYDGSAENFARAFESNTTDNVDETNVAYATDRWTFTSFVGGVSRNISLVQAAPPIGTPVTLTIEVDSVAGGRIGIDGVYSSYNTSITACSWDASTTLLGRPADTNKNIAGTLAQFLFQDT